MKKAIIFIVALLSINVFGQSQKVLEAGVVNLEKALASDVNGLVASGIYTIVKMKMAHPDLKMETLHHKMKKLVVNGATAEIRYKAALAVQYLENPWMFRDVKLAECQNPVAMFTRMATVLEEELLAAQ
ncbi:MAG TPA: hypothetical protein PKV71_07400 [Calditrichia bacterium]|nr:hypothetical protein [Calditrichota bacterium]HQV31684.1 hypothetical protein [Calditrichia bacterium]